MPRKHSWLKRIPEIRATVTALAPRTQIDAPGLAEMLRVAPRQALRLMRSLGMEPAAAAADRRGRPPLVVTRERLLARLHAPKTRMRHTAEIERRSRIAEQLVALRRDVVSGASRVKLRSWTRNEERFTLDRLPEGMRLEPGRLHIRFADIDDLAQQLFDLSYVLRREWSEAAARFNPGPSDGHPRPYEQQRALLRRLGLIE